MSPSTSGGAVVRKPPGKEPAGCGAQRHRTLYGDFEAALEDEAADDVTGGVIAQPRGGGNEAGAARQQECEGDLGLAGAQPGRALPRLALDQRDRSAQQRWMRLAGLMRCRS